MSKPPPGSYPNQGGYPTQPMAGYPHQPPLQQQQQYYPAPQMYQQQYPGQPPMMTRPPHPQQYGEPPPPYSSAPPLQHPQVAPRPYYPTQTRPAMPPQYPVMTQGQFDPGARFGPGTGAAPNIPPPPPRRMPTAAQMAASQGQLVVMARNPESWLSGGSDGGYTW